MQDLAADFIIENNPPIEFDAEINSSEHFDCSFEIKFSPDISHLATKQELSDAVDMLEDEIAQATSNIEGSSLIDVTKDGQTVTISSKTFVFEQGIASNIWEITHNLNKRPSITLVDTTGRVFEAYREYINDNQVNIKLESPTAGFAYLN